MCVESILLKGTIIVHIHVHVPPHTASTQPWPVTDDSNEYYTQELYCSCCIQLTWQALTLLYTCTCICLLLKLAGSETKPKMVKIKKTYDFAGDEVM